MSKKLGYIICAVLALSPCAAKADFDPLSFIQDQLSNYNDEINKMVNDYIGYELNAMQLVNSRDKLGDLKKMGKTYAMDKALALGSSINLAKIRSVSLSGIGEQVKGQFPNPLLEKTIRKRMSRKKQVANDVLQTRQHNEEINELQRENIATMYAKALVRRKQLIEEGERLAEEEKEEMTDLTLIKDAYKVVSSRANGRWKSMLESAANYQAQLGTALMLTFRIVDEEAVAEAANNAENATPAENSGETSDNETNGANFSLTDAYRAGTSLHDNIQSGNYAGALGDLSGAASGLGQSDVSQYLGTAQGAYNAGTRAADAAERGDWAGMATGIVGSATGLAGSYVDENTRDILNDINKGTNSANTAYQAGAAGNYGAALGVLADGASGYFDEKTGDILSSAGAAATASDRIADKIQDGNWTGAVSDALKTSGTAVGGIMDAAGGNGAEVNDVLTNLGSFVSTGAAVADTASGNGNAWEKGSSIWDSVANTAEGIQNTAGERKNQPSSADTPTSSSSADTPTSSGSNPAETTSSGQTSNNSFLNNMNWADFANGGQNNNAEVDNNNNGLPDIYEITPSNK